MALLRILLLIFTLGALAAETPSQEVWTFDRIDRIAGHATTVLGHPTQMRRSRSMAESAARWGAAVAAAGARRATESQTGIQTSPRMPVTTKA